MIDKVKRLKTYSEKDYTEVIDFPVELVGRDGVVRRYSYADSIRIYERRIESAHARYTDKEVINAEIYHCTRRLEQIKRSWSHRISTSESRYMEDHPGGKGRELFERGKQFITYFLAEVVGDQAALGSGAPSLVSLDEQSGCHIFYVNSPLLQPSTLLYVYRIGDDPAVLEEFEKLLACLEAAQLAPDTEKLIRYSQEEELGFILTSPRPDPLVHPKENVRIVAIPAHQLEQDGLGAWLQNLIRREKDEEASPFWRGTLAIRDGDLLTAFDAFREALDESPYHREAYWVVASLSDALERWQEAEGYLEMACRYFPDDPRSWYYSGLICYRRGAYEEAQRRFERAVQLKIQAVRCFGFLACTQVQRRQYRKALESLEAGLQARPRDQALMKLSVPLERHIRLYQHSLGLGLVLIALCTAMLLLMPALGTGLMWGMAIVLCILLTLRHYRNMGEVVQDWARPPGMLLQE